MAKRTYTNGEINVLWDSDLCTKCEACWRGLPEVFRPNEKPWVAVNAAPTVRIVEQVGQCPSGALQIERVEPGKVQ